MYFIIVCQINTQHVPPASNMRVFDDSKSHLTW